MATMMSDPHAPDAPRYVSGGRVYRADTCQALRTAAAAGEVVLEASARGTYPGNPLLESQAPGLRTVGYWDAPDAQCWGLDWHRNEGVEIAFLARGRLDVAVDEAAYSLAPGDLMITRPWQRHKVGCPNVASSRLHWCVIDVGVRRPDQAWRWPDWIALAPAELDRLTRLLHHNEQPVWHGGAGLYPVFQMLGADVSAATRPTIGSRLQVHVSGLLLAVLEALDTHEVVLNPELTSSRRSVDLFLRELECVLDEDWSLERMAASCGLRRTRFADYCKQLTNQTPLQYLANLRLARAADLLSCAPDLTVTDIALATGHGSSQYLARRFRAAYGITPREYRSLARNGDAQRPAPPSAPKVRRPQIAR
ncbi:MAG: AraC family transcriptional regulator [Pseudomonadota bacterium]